MILQAVPFRSHEVPTLVLSDFDVPLPGGGRGGGVDVQGDGDTGVTGGHPHVLASDVATNNRRWAKPRNTDYE